MIGALGIYSACILVLVFVFLGGGGVGGLWVFEASETQHHTNFITSSPPNTSQSPKRQSGKCLGLPMATCKPFKPCPEPKICKARLARPEVGDLLIRRVILQFRRAYKRTGGVEELLGWMTRYIVHAITVDCGGLRCL